MSTSTTDKLLENLIRRFTSVALEYLLEPLSPHDLEDSWRSGHAEASVTSSMFHVSAWSTSPVFSQAVESGLKAVLRAHGVNAMTKDTEAKLVAILREAHVPRAYVIAQLLIKSFSKFVNSENSRRLKSDTASVRRKVMEEGQSLQKVAEEYGVAVTEVSVTVVSKRALKEAVVKDEQRETKKKNRQPRARPAPAGSTAKKQQVTKDEDRRPEISSPALVTRDLLPLLEQLDDSSNSITEDESPSPRLSAFPAVVAVLESSSPASPSSASTSHCDESGGSDAEAETKEEAPSPAVTREEAVAMAAVQAAKGDRISGNKVSPAAARAVKATGDLGESAVQEALAAAGIDRTLYETEADLRAAAATETGAIIPGTLTPDFLFREVVRLTVGEDSEPAVVEVRWIDSKNVFHLPSHAAHYELASIRKQAEKYCRAFGPGVILWANGFTPAMQELLRDLPVTHVCKPTTKKKK
jgi:hypothetical protein